MGIKQSRTLFLMRAASYGEEPDLTDIAMLHRTYIGAVERGEQNVSIDTIQQIAAALKVKPETLFKGDITPLGK
jgi:transcriptional regulator with XRE-family HTH domain